MFRFAVLDDTEEEEIDLEEDQQTSVFLVDLVIDSRFYKELKKIESYEYNEEKEKIQNEVSGGDDFERNYQFKPRHKPTAHTEPLGILVAVSVVKVPGIRSRGV